MPRPKRCEFQGANYLLTLNGYSGGHVFYDPQIFDRFLDNPRGHAPNAGLFETLLWDVCEQYNARVHAYVLEPNSALVVMQTLGAPLGWVVHDLLARFSMHVAKQNQIPGGEKPFPRRYRAQIIQPEKLPYAVRYVQRRRIGPNRRRRTVNHPFSSSLIYCARRPQPACFVTGATYGALEPLGYLGPNAYFEFMATSDSPSIAEMLSRHIIGEAHFVKSVRERCGQPPTVPTSDELLHEVTGTLLHAEPGIACAPTHIGALARALIAWYAMRTGTARIGTVASWFGVTSSDLRYLIRRHRQTSPQYFSKSLPELFPEMAAREVFTAHSRSGTPAGIMKGDRPRREYSPPGS